MSNRERNFSAFTPYDPELDFEVFEISPDDLMAKTTWASIADEDYWSLYAYTQVPVSMTDTFLPGKPELVLKVPKKTTDFQPKEWALSYIIETLHNYEQLKKDNKQLTLENQQLREDIKALAQQIEEDDNPWTLVEVVTG